MTDDKRTPHDPDDAELRPAADALRAALRAHVDDVSFAPLDPASLRLLAQVREASGSADARASGGESGASDEGSGSGGERPANPHLSEIERARAAREARASRGGRSRRWNVALAAAVVVVLAVPVIAVVSQLRGGTSGAMSAPAAASQEYQTESRASTAAGPGASAPGGAVAQDRSLPSAAPGTSWVELGGAAVQVPESWVAGVAPGPDWCTSRLALPTKPYVAVDPVAAPAPDPACEAVPADRQVEHVEWREAQAGEVGAESRANGWVYSSRVVGSTLITHVHQAGASAAILDTARPVG